jgi:hypothetical protein
LFRVDVGEKERRGEVRWRETRVVGFRGLG